MCWWILVLVGCSLLATFFACALCKGGNPRSEIMNHHYKSIEYSTCNENGEEELTLEYDKTVFQWLFNRPNTVKTWVGGGDVWYDKITQYQVNNEELCDIRHLVAMMKFNKCPPADD